MVNYNLEEFKRWLNNQSEKNLPWWTKISTPIFLEKLIQREVYQSYGFANDNWKPYHQVALRWKAEVDEKKKKERERARRRNNV